jgi:transcriptional regulator with XRE-family HTH domain
MSPASQRRAEDRAREVMEGMLLGELRRLSGLTQTELSAMLGIKQPTLSQLESQDDMQISTLSRLVQALGGELEIIAKMPNGRIALRQFADT